jgi:hypothetical protein
MDSTISDAITTLDIDQIETAIASGAPINTHDRYGTTPLIMATMAQLPHVIKLLISKRVVIDGTDYMGCTALFWAVEFANIEIAKILLEAGANPNAYTTSGQPILAYPLLRRDQSMGRLLVDYGGKLSFARDYINTKLVGHRFELEHKVYISTPKPEYIRLSFEGFFLEFTLGIIRNSLELFIKKRESSQFKPLFKHVHKILSILDDASLIRKYRDQENIDHNKHLTQINQLLSKDPIIIPVAYEGHAITFVRYKNQVAQCDRGALSKRRSSISIYNMTRPNNLSLDFLRKMVYENNSGHFINMQVLAILGLELIEEIHTESQISGNCSWANVEASVICLLTMFQMDELSEDSSSTYAREMAMKFFLAWREWDKDRSLSMVIENFRRANKARKASKAAVLGAVLFHRLDPGNSRDIARAKKIVPILRKPDYRFIISSYAQIHCKKSKVTEQGKRFIKMLKMCGENIKLYM